MNLGPVRVACASVKKIQASRRFCKVCRCDGLLHDGSIVRAETTSEVSSSGVVQMLWAHCPDSLLQLPGAIDAVSPASHSMPELRK